MSLGQGQMNISHNFHWYKSIETFLKDQGHLKIKVTQCKGHMEVKLENRFFPYILTAFVIYVVCARCPFNEKEFLFAINIITLLHYLAILWAFENSVVHKKINPPTLFLGLWSVSRKPHQ